METLEECMAALDRYKASGDKKMQAAVMLAIAELNLQMQDVEGALVFLKKARSTFNEIQDTKGEATAFHKIAQLCTTIGDVEEALWSTQRATALFRKIKDQGGEAGILLVAADLCFAKAWGFMVQGVEGKSQLQAKEALRNAQLALALFRATEDKRGQALALLNIGNAHLMLKDSAAALQVASDCLAICEELDFEHGRAGALLVAGGAHLAEGRADAAQQSGAEARQMFQQRGDGMGEEAAASFLRDVRDFEAGDFKKENFAGFYLRGTDSFQPMPAEIAVKTARREEKRPRGTMGGTTLSSIQIFAPGGEPTVFFDGFESRQAGGTQQQGRLRQLKEAEEEREVALRPDAGPRYRAEAPPVYAVRWQGITPQPPKTRPDGKAARLTARAEGPLRGLIDAGPVGAGTTFPPMFKVSVRG